MNKWLGRFSGELYAILRIVAGFMFFCHGAQKVLGWWANPEKTEPLPPFIYFGGVLELVLGLLVMIGLLTSWAAFLAAGEMAVAYFKFHFAMEKFWPIQNGGELAVLYCFVFLYMAARGAGKWSVASALKKPQLE